MKEKFLGDDVFWTKEQLVQLAKTVSNRKSFVERLTRSIEIVLSYGNLPKCIRMIKA